MEIIREGDMALYEFRKKRTLQFTCTHCGCVFNADQNEYHDSQYDGVYCYCPCCKELTYPTEKENDI